jgi:anthranilate synthase
MLDEISPDLLFISPGPGFPSEQKVPELVGEALNRDIPVFGVCLGHQGIAEHFGGKLLTLEHPVHGKSAEIIHSGDSFYAGLPNPFSAGRYHSLYVDSTSLPECLEVTAKTDSGLIMGLRHKKLPVASVQFHPESILTLKDQSGLRMINKMMAELTSGTNNKEGS